MISIPSVQSWNARAFAKVFYESTDREFQQGDSFTPLYMFCLLRTRKVSIKYSSKLKMSIK